MPTLTISPEALQSVVRTPDVASTTHTASPKAFILGEVLDVLVTGHQPGQRVQLQIGDSSVIADTPVPLQLGDKLTVRVGQLHPALVLRIVGQPDEETVKLNDFVKLYRSNPDALKDVLTGFREFLSGNRLDALSGHLNPKDLLGLSKIMEKLIISKAKAENPQYLKDCVSALGLTVERDLLKALSDPTLLVAGKGDPTLKEILLRLASELQVFDANGHSSRTGTLPQADGFSRLVDQALRVIESLQIVNVLAQEQDQLFAFQVPFQCADGIRMQDVFIETDQSGSGSAKGRRYKVVLFVDMDALGEMAIEAGVQEGKLQCTIKCHTQETTAFVADYLPELQDKLADLGYVAPQIRCTLAGDLCSWKQDFLSEHRLYSQNTINICA
jgi:hypothetical protein